ncbi:GNAT family N-acetyltransferase [Gordonia aichiensis]
MTSPDTRSNSLELTRATDADWDEIITTDARAFAMRNPISDDERADLRGKVSDSDVVLVRDSWHDSHPLVGVSMFYRMQMTVPGGEQVPAAGLSWVSVASTHRRRGILRRMITELFTQWESEGFAFAILTASEGTIYERFGFGPACFAESVEVAPGRPTLRAEAPDHPEVYFATPEQVAATIPDIHSRWTRTRPGALTRTRQWWAPILADRPSERPPAASGLHYLLHPDGYASYRIHKSSAGQVRGEVEELVAITDTAHTELWRVLLGLDLIPSLTASIPVDDPLRAKLTDLRAAPVTGRADKMWVSILDVPAALATRQYSADLDIVLEVTDSYRERGGVYDISIRNGGAIIAPSTSKPTVRMDISVLSSLYLGGVTPALFARADRLWTDSEETLHALTASFAVERAPFSGTFF